MKTKMCHGCSSNCRRLPDLDGVIVLAFGEGAVPVPQGLNVRFIGGIRERRDLARLLAAADVFASASLMETYGLTLVEAMACGTPVVAFESAEFLKLRLTDRAPSYVHRKMTRHWSKLS